MNLYTYYDNLFLDILKYYEGSILICDTKGKIMLCSEGTCRLCGLSSEELLHTDVYTLKETGVLSESASINCLETQSPSMIYLIINHDANNGIYAHARPIFDADHNLIRVITFSQSESFSKQYRQNMEELAANYQKALNTVLNPNNPPLYIAESPITKKIFNYTKKIAKSDASIIIYGESGTGKEVLAKYVHQNSLRSNEIFLPVNCATIPDTLMESEIFGYEKGSFTGANRNGKTGLFELANGGTLFLDEIGELPLTLQPKLLRVLETGEIRKLGGTSERKVDVRIVSATNRNLLEMVKEGTFREDLYYRLNIIPITMPSLREREEDIESLANFFLDHYNEKYNKSLSIQPLYMSSLIEYNWPGNIRELKNVIQRYVITDGMSALPFAQDLPSPNKMVSTSLNNTTADLSSAPTHNIYNANQKALSFKEYKYNCELDYFKQLLECTNGNVSKVASISKLHMSGIYKKLNSFPLNPKDYQK